MKQDWILPFQIETRVAQIITQQEINGWQFDERRARWRYHVLEDYCRNIETKISPFIKQRAIQVLREINCPFKIDGTYKKSVEDWYKEDVYWVGGPFCRVQFEKPKITQREKFAEELIQYGWIPEEFTETGKPRLTIDGEAAPSLKEIKGNFPGELLSNYYTYKHRQSLIVGLLKNLRSDGRISACADTLGTNTGRMRHKVVVNIPKAKPNVLFGKEIRELFIVKKGYLLCGHDATGLEARTLGHYLNDQELIDLLIDPEKDFHSRIWKEIEDFVYTRDQTKNVEYALFYGASDYKLGTMSDVDVPVFRSKKDLKSWYNNIGKEIRRRIMKGIPALGNLLEGVNRIYEKRGYLIGIDGRKLFPRAKHSAFNTLNQGCGAIVMKKSMIYLDDWVKKENLDVKKVGDFHDEAQAEVHPNDVERYCELAIESIKKAGEFFNLNCVLDAEAKIGKNWAETH